MNDDVGPRIAQVLDQGNRTLDAATLARLAAMRREALASRGHTPAGHGLLAWTHHHPWRAGLLVASLLSALGLSLMWQPPTDNSELDILLLTDELPPQAYAEQEFKTWLKSHAR